MGIGTSSSLTVMETTLKVPTLSKIYKDRPWVLRRSYCNSDVAEFIKLKTNPHDSNSEVPLKIFSLSMDFISTSSLVIKSNTSETFKLYHDVLKSWFVITNEEGETLLSATDTNSMTSAPRRKYDYLKLREGNHDEDKVVEARCQMMTLPQCEHNETYATLSAQSFENSARAHERRFCNLSLHESDTHSVYHLSLGVNNNNN